jgi:hypothetical protein
MPELWERRERHVVTDTGPSVVDAADAVAALHRALSDWRQIAAEPPNAEVPPGAVTLSAAGGVLTVQIEHFEPAAGAELDRDLPVEGERDDDLT